jgi:hypothetical protein
LRAQIASTKSASERDCIAQHDDRWSDFVRRVVNTYLEAFFTDSSVAQSHAADGLPAPAGR